jgi:FkbM family methyltransferase
MINIRSSLLKRFNNAVHGDIALISHEGCHFLLAKRNRLDMKMMGGMDWERGLRDRATREIDRHGLDLLIDAGANLGLYTIDLNLRCALKETVAFEPQPNNFNQLCGNIFANNLDDRATADRSALSDRDGEALMSVDTAFTIHSTLGANGTNDAKFDKSIAVRLIRFDDHYPFENRRAFLKMDVEGHEISALNGMTRFLERNKVSIQVEANDAEFPAVRAMLTALGYRHEGDRNIDHFFSNL